MAGYEHRVASAELGDAREVLVDGASPLNSFERTQSAIARLCGPDAASLFAEPAVSRGDDGAARSVSWYGPNEGAARPLSQLDPEQGKVAKQTLTRKLDALKPALRDPSIGPETAARLNLRSPDDILVAGGEPILVNWGLLPAGLEPDEASRKAHFDSTLGPYTDFDAPPPSQPGHWPSFRKALAAGGLGAAAAGAAMAAAPGAAAAQSGGEPSSSSGGGDAPGSASGASPSGSGGGAPGGGQPPGGGGAGGEGGDAGEPPRRVLGWGPPFLPVLAAVIVAAIILIILLIPGVRLFAEDRGGPDYDAATRDQRDANDALEERLDRLRLALEQDMCVIEEDYATPQDLEEALGPNRTRPPAGAAPIDPNPLIPPSPDQLAPSTEPGAPERPAEDTSSLLDQLDTATALIVAEGGGRSGMGTGFFVNETDIVTNRHVIMDGAATRVLAASPSLTPRPVQVVAIGDSSQGGGQDFAVLRLADPAAPATLTLSDRTSRLDNVIAAGFPSIVISADAGFDDFIAGDTSAAPQLNVTQGVITSLQQSRQGQHVIVHSAAIAPGNSGGPLSDLCGRAVGVNTYLRSDQSGSGARTNNALHATSLAAFLTANNIAFTLSDAACAPALRNDAAQAGGADAGGPDAGAADPAPTGGQDTDT